MSRTYSRLTGTGALGYFLPGTDRFKATTHAIPLQYDLELAALASFMRNLYVGGDWAQAIDASSAGDVDIPRYVPFVVDNTGSQLSGATSLVCQVRVYVRVSNALVSVTPKIVYGTALTNLTTAATITGQLACVATNSDYSGTNQLQTVALTLPVGVSMFKVQLTIGGAPAAGYQCWAYAVHDLYVSS